MLGGGNNIVNVELTFFKLNIYSILFLNLTKKLFIHMPYGMLPPLPFFVFLTF